MADVRDAEVVAAADCDIENVERAESETSALSEAVAVEAGVRDGGPGLVATGVGDSEEAAE